MKRKLIIQSLDQFTRLPTVTPKSLGWVDSGGLNFSLSADVTITNRNLNITGCTITGAGRIILAGTASLTGNGTISNGVGQGSSGAVVIASSGAYKISGVKFTGISALAAVIVEPVANAVINPLVITNNSISNSNYGVLRQGGAGAVTTWTISNNTINTMQGDGIEWNVCPADRNGLISNNRITGINNTSSFGNWGIGIGVAGLSYTDNFLDGQTCQDFVITGNTITSSCVGIHVEQGNNFTITNNLITDISASYSVGTGLEEAGIVCYGCNNFSLLRNNLSTADQGNALYVLPGVISAVYTGLPITFTVDHNVWDNTSWFTGIQWSTSGNPTITNNTGYTFQSFGSIPVGFTGGTGNTFILPWASN